MIDLERRWIDRAACAGMPSEVFFADASGGSSEYDVTPHSKRDRLYIEAKKVCHRCPVEMECRRDSMGELHGVWGGLDPGERRAARRRASIAAMAWGERRKRNVGKLILDMQHRGVILTDIAITLGLEPLVVRTLSTWYRQDRVRRGIDTVPLPGDYPPGHLPAVNEEERRQILNLSRSKLTMEGIGRAVGRSRSTVQKVINEARTEAQQGDGSAA